MAIVVAVPVSMPALAAASSLLSGYGGPGQGSQAILGSALLGGSSGGSGGSTGSSSDSFRYGERHGGTESSATSPAGAGGSTSGSTSSGGASAGGVSAYPASSAELASSAGAVQSETLGLSGDDLLYVLLALAAVAFTGVLTRQLARTNDPDKNNG